MISKRLAIQLIGGVAIGAALLLLALLLQKEDAIDVALNDLESALTRLEKETQRLEAQEGKLTEAVRQSVNAALEAVKSSAQRLSEALKEQGPSQAQFQRAKDLLARARDRRAALRELLQQLAPPNP